jgi:hypothetical protein
MLAARIKGPSAPRGCDPRGFFSFASLVRCKLEQWARRPSARMATNDIGPHSRTTC